MKNFLTIATLLLLSAFSVFAQTPAPAFPSVPLPLGVAGFVEYNQLGTPQVVGGVTAIYPVSGQLGLYATTTALLSPQKVIDPTTQRSFYAVTTQLRQGLHKDVLDTGRWSFLIGGDVGPSIGSSATSGLTVNFASSIVLTPLYQVSPAVSLILPVRGIYVSNVGWNPVVEFGVVFNLSKLKAASTQK